MYRAILPRCFTREWILSRRKTVEISPMRKFQRFIGRNNFESTDAGAAFHATSLAEILQRATARYSLM